MCSKAFLSIASGRINYMKNCDHKNLKKGTVTKKFLSHTFKAEAQICKDCGAELWDNKLNAKFQNWLKDLDVENQKQYKVSKSTDLLMKEFGSHFNCTDESKLVRSIIAVLNKKLSNPIYNNIFNEILDSEDFKRLKQEPLTLTKKVRITNPKSLYDIENWKEILDLNDSEFIRTYIVLILVIKKQVNNKFAKFWNCYIKDDLEMVLAA